MGPEQTAPIGSSLIWVHTVCHRGFLNISADEKSRRILLLLAHKGLNPLFLLIAVSSLRYPISFHTCSNFCHLLMIFANSLDSDQDRLNVGPDLEPNCLTWKQFFETANMILKKSADDKKSMKNYPAAVCKGNCQMKNVAACKERAKQMILYQDQRRVQRCSRALVVLMPGFIHTNKDRYQNIERPRKLALLNRPQD